MANVIMHQCPFTHFTRLKGGIKDQFAAVQFAEIIAKLAIGITQGINFCMATLIWLNRLIEL